MRKLAAAMAVVSLLQAPVVGAYDFSALSDGQHLAFDPAVDVLNFDDPAITAAAVRVTQVGADLGFSWAGRTVWLDGVSIGQISVGPSANVAFANGSVLGVGDGTPGLASDADAQAWDLSATAVGQQLWGLGGADRLTGGGAADWLVGNGPLRALNHVSRVDATGSPTGSTQPGVSGDGRFVAFAGGWTGFGSGSNSSTDVLVKDMQAGTVANEHQDALGASGTSGAGAPAISADGTVVAFHSASTNLVPGPDSGALYDVFVAEVGGSGIERVSTGPGGALAVDGRSQNADISGDGRYVVFESAVSNLAPGGSIATYDVYLKDRLSGDLTRLSTSLAGGDGDGDSTRPRISHDGRFVVFQSAATNLTAGDTNGYTDVFLWDRADGSLANLTAGVPATNPNNGSFLPDVAAAGVVVFETAKGLAAADVCTSTDIYAYDVVADVFTLVSSRADGSCSGAGSTGASVSADGRFVAFTGSSETLVTGDANGVADVFVKDRARGSIALVSRAPAAQGTHASGRARISLGGDVVAFESAAANLAATDANGTLPDVFLVGNPLLRDALAGGAGNDTYEVFRNETITEQAGGGIDTVVASVSWTLGANLENLTLAGTANLNGTGNSLNNVITGNAGDNVINGGGGVDTASYAAAAGPVTVRLAVATAQATGAGNDTLVGIESLVGSPFSDRLEGNDGANRLDGGPGGPGRDVMIGGRGNDTYVCDASTDVVSEAVGAGTDTVISSVTWTLSAPLENLTLAGPAAINGSGNQAANTITGNGAANVLNGWAGDDTIRGMAGDDTLRGGAGNDTLTGGAGADTFALDSTVGADAVTDFTVGVDRVGVRMSAIRIGDGDAVVDGALTRAAPGAFGPGAELVVFTANLADLTPARAAAGIGSATAAYAAGDRRLFVVDNGASSAVYLFASSGADALVSAGELTLLATLNGRPNTTPASYVFVP